MIVASWPRVDGVLARGARRASGIDRDTPYAGRGTLEWQFPLFKERGLDLSGCFIGTLNIIISPRTWRLLPGALMLCDVLWYENRKEDFAFSQCHLLFAETIYPAWVYVVSPGKPHHIRGPHLLEIIAQHIPGITYGATVTLEINPEEIEVSRPS